jgi:YD repeat-containing protein
VLEDPTHVYTQSRSFTVTLTVTTRSASDSEVKPDYITICAPSEPALVARTITYTYDGLYRLTGANYSTGESFTHIYDAVGNRTRMTSTTPLSSTVVTTHAYDATNRLASRAMSDGRAYSYVWSAWGQLLSEWTQGYPVRTFAYDCEYF